MPPDAPDADATQARPKVPPVKSLQGKSSIIINDYNSLKKNLPVGKNIGQAKDFMIAQRM
jgi:hypothetical protein